MSWKPQRTLAEGSLLPLLSLFPSLTFLFPAEALLTSPGSLHEVETCLVDGRLQRVYKNLWPSLREFWLNAVSKYSNDIYIVYEDQRLTYRQVHHRAVKVAALLQNIYGIQKGVFAAQTADFSLTKYPQVIELGFARVIAQSISLPSGPAVRSSFLQMNLADKILQILSEPCLSWPTR